MRFQNTCIAVHFMLVKICLYLMRMCRFSMTAWLEPMTRLGSRFLVTRLWVTPCKNDVMKVSESMSKQAADLGQTQKQKKRLTCLILIWLNIDSSLKNNDSIAFVTRPSHDSSNSGSNRKILRWLWLERSVAQQHHWPFLNKLIKPNQEKNRKIRFSSTYCPGMSQRRMFLRGVLVSLHCVWK